MKKKPSGKNFLQKIYISEVVILKGLVENYKQEIRRIYLKFSAVRFTVLEVSGKNKLCGVEYCENWHEKRKKQKISYIRCSRSIIACKPFKKYLQGITEYKSLDFSMNK